MTFDVTAIRSQFPILAKQIDGKPLVYFDNAATTQKPQCVIDSITSYYQNTNSNVHRGAHRLADEATSAFEQARKTVAAFLHAQSTNEIIWTSGTTEGCNLVAHGLAKQLKAGDEVLVTQMEHHANLVTWQQACLQAGAKLCVAPIHDNGELDVQTFEDLLNEKTVLVSVPHVSNALGTINPIAKLVSLAKKFDALVFIDGAQGIAHEQVDVQQLGCDFYAFSAHKLFGPTGMGVLWGKESVLESWPVWKTGGEMIAEVDYQWAKWNVLPYKFEAGTPNICGAIATAAAIEWFMKLDMKQVQAHEKSLLSLATTRAENFDGLNIIGTAKDKVGVLSFVMDAGHSADIGFLLDRQGVAVRTGHHCAEPLMKRLGLSGTARASFSIYNTLDEVEVFFDALTKVRDMLV